MAASYPTSAVSYGQDGFHNTGDLCLSTLTAAIVGSPTTFAIASASTVTTWPTTNFMVRIESELVFVSSRTGLVCTIGARGESFATSRVDHASGTEVRVVEISPFIQKICAEIAAMQVHAGVLGPMVHASVTTTPYTVTDADFIVPVNATAAAATVNLPTAVGRKGRSFAVVKTDSTSNTVTVDGNAAETVGGDATQVLAARNAVIHVMSDGANWLVVGESTGETSASVLDYIKTLSVAGSPVKQPEITTLALAPGVSTGTIVYTIAPGVGLQLAASTAFYVQTKPAWLDVTATSVAYAGGNVAAGVVREWSGFLNPILFSGLAANGVVGIDLCGIAATSPFSKTASNTVDRAMVGVDSAGLVSIITCNGTAITVTSTGVTVVANQSFRVDAVLTFGTSFSVAINGGAPTVVTATLPRTGVQYPYPTVGGVGASTIGLGHNVWKHTPA